MYWVYILKDSQTGRYYVGSTGDLERRLNEHSYWKPTYILIYKEQMNTKESAYSRELYLKSGATCVLIVICSLTAVATDPKSLPTDLLIALERTPCFGTCPTYRVTISSDGSVIYDGRAHVNRMGILRSSITVDDLEKLFSEFKKHDFFEVDGRYDEMDDSGDASFVITSIRANGREKTIKRYTLPKIPPPDWLIQLEERIDQVSGASRWTDSVVALKEDDYVIAHSTDPTRLSEALYNSGQQLYREQKYLEAITRWRRIIDQFPASKYRKDTYLRIGHVQFGLGQFNDALRTYQAFISDYPNTIEVQEIKYQIIMCYHYNMDLKNAYTQYVAFKANYPSDPRNPELCHMLFDTYNASKAQESSAEITQGVLNCDPNQSAADILWERGKALYNKKDYSSAQKYFQRIMLAYPTDNRTETAYFYNADCYFLLKQFSEAANAYKSFYSQYPNGKNVAAARMQEILILARISKCAEASDAFIAFKDQFPRNPSIADIQKTVQTCK